MQIIEQLEDILCFNFLFFIRSDCYVGKGSGWRGVMCGLWVVGVEYEQVYLSIFFRITAFHLNWLRYCLKSSVDVLRTKVFEYTDGDMKTSDFAKKKKSPTRNKTVICLCACTEGNIGEPCIEAAARREFGYQLWGV